jgi:transcription initiation factor TFIIH subunit 2
MAHEEDPKHMYKWEQGINATWESVQEDEFGNIMPISTERDRSQRAKQNRITQSIRRGLIRFLVVAVDCSISAGEKDYRPSRLEVSKNCVSKFILEYYDQNPISQLSLALTRDRVAEKITDLSGNPKIHIHKLASIITVNGLASLQNTIILGINTLRHIPSYGHRELLIVYNSLSTCDPGDIFQTIKEAKFHKIRISIICLVAEIFICKQICELTNGIFSVAIDSIHLSELLNLHTIPPPEIQEKQTLKMDFIYMGFPKRVFSKFDSYGFDGKKVELCKTAYICPRCHTKATDIPTQCCVCHLQLNSSSHIARSYHHLFPVCLLFVMFSCCVYILYLLGRVC